MQNPEDRRDAAHAYVEQVGGALHGFWYGFGCPVKFELTHYPALRAVGPSRRSGSAVPSYSTRRHSPEHKGSTTPLLPSSSVHPNACGSGWSQSKNVGRTSNGVT